MRHAGEVKWRAGGRASTPERDRLSLSDIKDGSGSGLVRDIQRSKLGQKKNVPQMLRRAAKLYLARRNGLRIDAVTCKVMREEFDFLSEFERRLNHGKS